MFVDEPEGFRGYNALHANELRQLRKEMKTLADRMAPFNPEWARDLKLKAKQIKLRALFVETRDVGTEEFPNDE